MARRIASAVWILSILMVFVAGQQMPPSYRGENGALCFVMICISSTFFHELGHAIAGIARGAKVRSFSVWGIGYDLENRRIGPKPPRHGRDLAGFVTFRPRSGRKFSDADEAIIAIAGPLANVVSALVVMMSTYLVESEAWHVAAIMFSITSFGMLGSNTLPFEGSDGSKVLRFIASRR